MNVLKEWLITVYFEDGSCIENFSKKNFRENGIMDIIKHTEKKFPNKKIISVQIL